MAEKRIKMEKAAKAACVMLPEFKITPFNGTSNDWIRFESMFTSLIHSKPLSGKAKNMEPVKPTITTKWLIY